MPTRRTRRPRRHGGSVLNSLKKLANVANEQAKQTKILSKTLKQAGYNTSSGVVDALGYGRKRRRHRHRKGGNFLGSLGQFGKNVLSIPLKGLAGTAMGLNAGVQGLGHRRVRRGGRMMLMPQMERFYA